MKKKLLAFLLVVLVVCQMCLPVLATGNENIYMIEIIDAKELPEESKEPQENVPLESEETKELPAESKDSQEKLPEATEEAGAEVTTEESAPEEETVTEQPENVLEETTEEVPEEPEVEVKHRLSMKKSTDGGVHWSEPKVLSIKEPDIEEDNFEAIVVEADKKLYLLTNYSAYYFSEDEGETWSQKNSLNGLFCTGCQLLASSYFEPADGTTSIFLTVTSEEDQQCKRLGYVVQEDGTLHWNYEYVEIEEGAFYEIEKDNAEAAPEISKHSDRTIAMISSVLIDEEASGVLHHHKDTGVAESAAESFHEECDETAFIENAEFTFTQVEAGWHIRNEIENVYLSLDAGENFYRETEAVVHIDHGPEGHFHIRNEAGPYAIFNATNMTFDRWDYYLENDPGLKYDLTLLKWSEGASEEEIIPGYVKVSGMEDGGSYLIAYIRDDGVFILYPTAPQNAQTKLCTVKEAERKGVVTIIGIETGMTNAVVDGVTYEISVVPPTVPTEAIKITTGSQQSEEEGGKNVIDGDESTIWHSAYDRTEDQGYEDLWIQMKLDDVYAIDEVQYLPCQSDTDGVITKYKLLISVDGENWAETMPKEWEKDNTKKVARLATPVNAKYVRIQVLDSLCAEGYAYASAAEIQLIGVVSGGEY